MSYPPTNRKTIALLKLLAICAVVYWLGFYHGCCFEAYRITEQLKHK